MTPTELEQLLIYGGNASIREILLLLKKREYAHLKKYLNSSLKAAEAIYHRLHRITTAPLCSEGNPRKFKSKGVYDYGYCSSRCKCFLDSRTEKFRNKTEEEKNEILLKKRASMLEKYGAEEIFKSDHYKDKVIEQYGVNNPIQSSVIKERVKKTNIARYGHHHSLDPSVQAKKKETNSKKYGGHPMRNSEVKNKFEDTCVHRYGASHPMLSDLVREKHKESISRIDYSEVVKKSKETFARKYGSYPLSPVNENSTDLHVEARSRFIEANKKALRRHYAPGVSEILDCPVLLERHIEGKSFHKAADDLGIDVSTLQKNCAKYGIHRSKSSYEDEISSFLESIEVKYVKDTRKIISPLELDFYVEDHNLAIEFNGLYYHSDSSHGVPDDFHKRKLVACRYLGIHLIQIFEDEWISKSEIIKNKIKILCGKAERGLPARKLRIVEISKNEAENFCEQYHLQGNPHGTIYALGAYENDDLVSVITFRQQRGSRQIELSRFCTSGKIHAGLMSKFMSHFEKHTDFEKVITFADLRYSVGNLYNQSNFVKEAEIRPDYYYTKSVKRFHKSNFSKKQIRRKFGIDTSNRTEKEIMRSLGYYRVWDCGKIRYSWSRFIKK